MKPQFNHFKRSWSCSIAWVLTAVALLLSIREPEAAIVWNGPLLTYVQPGTNALLAANQDRLTADVWLTRNNIKGLFNAAFESTYALSFSPSNTEWAFGELANYASLTYTNWEDLTGGNPPALIGQDAVVHLISDDIYLSINFTTWVPHGGTFSYVRSTPSLTSPPPAAPVLQDGVAAGTNLFQIAFTNLPNYSFTVRGTTNLSLAATNWPVLGQAVDLPAGSGAYQFIDNGGMTNSPVQFYRVTWP